MGTEVQPDFNRRPAIVVGGILITVGILSLVSQFIPGIGLMIWAALLAALGVGVFIFYLTDTSQHGLLIPAYILWAIAGLLVGISFGFLDGIIIPVYMMGALTLPFIYGFGRNPRENWGFLIPAYVFLAIGVFLLGIGANVLQEMAIPVFILSAIGIPFLIGFARNPKQNWGLLIPAYVMFAISGMLIGIGLDILNDLLTPAYVMFAMAVPFLLTFALNRRDNWWALIPGGIFSALCVGFLAGTHLLQYGLPAALILIGLIVLIVPSLVKNRVHRAAEDMYKPLTGPEADKAPEGEPKVILK